MNSNNRRKGRSLSRHDPRRGGAAVNKYRLDALGIVPAAN